LPLAISNLRIILVFYLYFPRAYWNNLTVASLGHFGDNSIIKLKLYTFGFVSGSLQIQKSLRQHHCKMGDNVDLEKCFEVVSNLVSEAGRVI